jgi:iron complex outermembrane receptor protein
LKRASLLRVGRALIALAPFLVAGLANAQAVVDFVLPEQPLANSLREIAARTSTNILFDRALVAGRTAPAIRARTTLRQALEQLLIDTNLTYRYLDENTITVVLRPAPPPDTAHPPSGAAQSMEGQGLEEIIVTAERRAAGLQNVAGSVTALNSQALESAGVRNTSELQLRTPGLLISSNGTYGQPYLRGVGSDIINPGADSPIAVFIDGAYQARQAAALTDLYDVERVEILKGPQGTLYGRNASGGAIQLITHDPVPTPDAALEVDVGSSDTRAVRAMANLPLNDAWALRLAGMVSRRDGYTRNVFNDTRLNDEDVTGLRAKLAYRSRGSFSAVVTAEHTNEGDSRNGANKVLDTPRLPLPVRDLAARFGYTPPDIPADPLVVRYDFQPDVQQEQWRFNVTARWQLGDLEISSISGYTRLIDDVVNDLDGTEVSFSYDREAGYSRAFTQTVQAGSTGAQPFEWIGGVELFEEHGGQHFDARLPLFGPPAPAPVPGFIWQSTLQTRAAAAFVDGRLTLSDHWTLSAGVRYSRERKEADFLQTIIDPLGELTGDSGTTFKPARPQRTFDAWTPKLRIEYRPAASLLIYASATRGFKSGGFNLMNVGEVFQPEKIWSLEGGLKATWLDSRLRTNAALFTYDYRDLQVNQFSGVTNLVTNAATSRIRGLEMELAAKPASWAQVDLAAALLDASYSRYLMLDANDPRSTLDLSGNRMPRAPRVTLLAGIESNVAMGTFGRLNVRAEARYQSLTYFDQLDTPQLAQGGYTIVNARAAFVPARQRWSIALYGANLTNRIYRQGVVRVDNVLGTMANFGAPRTYGIRIYAHL